jgi:hypothetical protein
MPGNISPSEQPSKPVRIYAMPEKFMIEDSGGGGKNNTFLIVIVIVVVVILLGVGAFMLIQRSSKPNDNSLLNLNSNLNVNAVTNSNKNANNANQNSNALNINISTNANTVANISLDNLNLFQNSNANANMLVNVNTVVQSSQDTDADGLTDVEEGLYGTSISLPDTDGDGYVDGQEAASGYDPASKGKLQDSVAIRQYSDPTEGYSLLYPAAWTLSDDPQNTRGKMFSTNGEFMEVSVQENPSRLSARDWYLSKSPSVDSSLIVSVSNWDKSLSGVQSPNGLTVYFTKGDKAYVIDYNINVLTQVNFKTTFQMMNRSFTVGQVTTNTNSNQTSNINGNSNTANNTNRNANTTNNNQNTNINTNTNTNSNTNNSNRF